MAPRQPKTPSPRGGGPDIALFLLTLNGGGAERVMLRLAEAFAARGFNVEVVVACMRGALADTPAKGFRFVDLGVGRPMFSLPALVRYLRRSRPRVLMSSVQNADLMAIMARALVRDVPLVLRIANIYTQRKGWKSFRRYIGFGIERALSGGIGRIVTVARGLEAGTAEALGVDKGIISTIYSPCAEVGAKVEGDLPAEHRAMFRKPVVMGMGRLTEAKDFATLVRAFALFSEKRDANLVILGEGPQREELLALARALGVGERVFLPGFTKIPAVYMRKAELFVLSSRWEGLANVLIEALALGLKIVSTDCPEGPREVTLDGKFGTLVPVGDVDAMAQAMGEAFDGPALKVDAELKAHLKQFSLDYAADVYLRVLTSVMRPA